MAKLSNSMLHAATSHGVLVVDPRPMMTATSAARALKTARLCRTLYTARPACSCYYVIVWYIQAAIAEALCQLERDVGDVHQ